MKNEKVDYTGVYIVKINKLEKEIKRLTFESTKWESKFYDEAKKVDKAIEYIEKYLCPDNVFELNGEEFILLQILRGEDNSD